MIKRRSFLQSIVALTIAFFSSCGALAAEKHPNILWITCEDISANLGCYGDDYARTPNLDMFAAAGVRFTNMYATAPVCSPARSCIITGIHACSLGTQHLRSSIPKPATIKCFTEYLRAAGYYCTNNSKQDYQFKTPKSAWDESSKTAHWRKRPKNRPFFSVFNLTMTHQSQTRYTGPRLSTTNAGLPAELRHDPAEAPLPPYYPDTKLIRENVAAYYTQITLMDQKVGQILKELEEDDLTENTIVFFYSDHGGGIPRGKRWLHHNGIRVPLIIRCPDPYRHFVPGKPGATSDRLVSFVDLAPTMLGLVGLPSPDYLQGKAFLGTETPAPRDFVFASRDRVDEVILCSRTVVDGKFQYIRNFLPHRPRMPLSWYSEKTPIRQELRRLNVEGNLQGKEAWLLAETTPVEEFYDLSLDPHQLNNLVTSSKHQQTIETLREKLYSRMLAIRDTGLLTESQMQERYPESPYTGMHMVSNKQYETILNVARLVGMGVQHRENLIRSLSSTDSAARYWAAVGLAALGHEARPAKDALLKALTDSSPSVRIAAAETLCMIGHTDEALPVLAAELKTGTDSVVIEAATALLALGPIAEPTLADVQTAKKRKLRYAGWALDHVLGNLE
jgi:N-sulfoglucosamine sulfohydrolase